MRRIRSPERLTILENTLRERLGDDKAQEVLRIIKDYSPTPEELATNVAKMLDLFNPENERRMPNNWWQDLSLQTARMLVEIAAWELGKKKYLLKVSGESDFLKNIEALAGKNLSMLRMIYAQNVMEKREFIEKKAREIGLELTDEDFSKGGIYILSKLLDIFPHTTGEWFERISDETETNWAYVPLEVQRAIVEKAAREIYFPFLDGLIPEYDFSSYDYLPLYRVTSNMLMNNLTIVKNGERIKVELPRIEFINRDSLGGLLNYYGDIITLKKTLHLYPELSEKNKWLDMIIKMDVDWEQEIPPPIQYFLVRQLAQENSLSVFDLKEEFFRTPLSFLNGYSLIGLWDLYQSIPDMQLNLIVPEMISEIEASGELRLRSPQTVEEWIAKFKMVGIREEEWQQEVPSTAIYRFLQIVSWHRSKKIEDLEKNDLMQPIPVFGVEGSNGRSLVTLYNAFGNMESIFEAAQLVRNKMMPQLIRKVGPENAEIIYNITEQVSNLYGKKDRIEENLKFILDFLEDNISSQWWDNLPLLTQRIFAEIVAYEFYQGKAYLLTPYTDFERESSILGGRRLLGLKAYYSRDLESKKNSIIQRAREELGILLSEEDFHKEAAGMYVLRKALDILPRTTEEWIDRIVNANIHNWDEVPEENLRAILRKAMDEVYSKVYSDILSGYEGPVPLYRITARMLNRTRLPFLNGQTLGGLYNYFASITPEDGKAIVTLKKTLDLYPDISDKESWLDLIRNMTVFWTAGEVPPEIQYYLVLKIAQERSEKEGRRISVLQVSRDNIAREEWEFLGGKNLPGMLKVYNNSIVNMRVKLLIPQIPQNYPANLEIPTSVDEFVAYFGNNPVGGEFWQADYWRGVWERNGLSEQDIEQLDSLLRQTIKTFLDILLWHLEVYEGIKKDYTELRADDFSYHLKAFGPDPDFNLSTLLEAYGSVEEVLRAAGIEPAG